MTASTSRNAAEKGGGELHFLPGYCDEAISLQYSPREEFTFPPNVFVIGTMNKADRSIVRIDTAMRCWFAFVELDPGPAGPRPPRPLAAAP